MTKLLNLELEELLNLGRSGGIAGRAWKRRGANLNQGCLRKRFLSQSQPYFKNNWYQIKSFMLYLHIRLHSNTIINTISMQCILTIRLNLGKEGVWSSYQSWSNIKLQHLSWWVRGSGGQLHHTRWRHRQLQTWWQFQLSSFYSSLLLLNTSNRLARGVV